MILSEHLNEVGLFGKPTTNLNIQIEGKIRKDKSIILILNVYIWIDKSVNKLGTIEELKMISVTAVRRLRRQKLANGKPFLIWSDKLPKNQSYLEYPDHSIKIVTVAPNLKSFEIIKELNSSQAQIVRMELNLI